MSDKIQYISGIYTAQHFADSVALKIALAIVLKAYPSDFTLFRERSNFTQLGSIGQWHGLKKDTYLV